MKYKIVYSNHFEKDYARCKKRGYDLSILRKAVTLLAETGTLPATYKPHKLAGKYKGLWESICSLIGCWFGSKTTRN